MQFNALPKKCSTFLPLALVYHDSAHGEGAFACSLLLWYENETIPHVLDIQNRLLRIAQPCPTKKVLEKDLVSGKRDSDQRPQPWQGCALPTELFPQSIPAPRKPLFPAFRDCKYKMKKIILQNFPTNFIT